MFLFVSLSEGYTYSARLTLLPFCPIIPVVAARTWITAGQFLVETVNVTGSAGSSSPGLLEISELEQAYLAL